MSLQFVSLLIPSSTPVYPCEALHTPQCIRIFPSKHFKTDLFHPNQHLPHPLPAIYHREASMRHNPPGCSASSTWFMDSIDKSNRRLLILQKSLSTQYLTRMGDPVYTETEDCEDGKRNHAFVVIFLYLYLV